MVAAAAAAATTFDIASHLMVLMPVIRDELDEGDDT